MSNDAGANGATRTAKPNTHRRRQRNTPDAAAAPASTAAAADTDAASSPAAASPSSAPPSPGSPFLRSCNRLVASALACHRRGHTHQLLDVSSWPALPHALRMLEANDAVLAAVERAWKGASRSDSGEGAEADADAHPSARLHRQILQHTLLLRAYDDPRFDTSDHLRLVSMVTSVKLLTEFLDMCRLRQTRQEQVRSCPRNLGVLLLPPQFYSRLLAKCVHVSNTHLYRYNQRDLHAMVDEDARRARHRGCDKAALLMLQLTRQWRSGWRPNLFGRTAPVPILADMHHAGGEGAEAGEQSAPLRPLMLPSLSAEVHSSAWVHNILSLLLLQRNYAPIAEMIAQKFISFERMPSPTSELSVEAADESLAPFLAPPSLAFLDAYTDPSLPTPTFAVPVTRIMLLQLIRAARYLCDPALVRGLLGVLEYLQAVRVLFAQRGGGAQASTPSPSLLMPSPLLSAKLPGVVATRHLPAEGLECPLLEGYNYALHAALTPLPQPDLRALAFQRMQVKETQVKAMRARSRELALAESPIADAPAAPMPTEEEEMQAVLAAQPTKEQRVTEAMLLWEHMCEHFPLAQMEAAMTIVAEVASPPPFPLPAPCLSVSPRHTLLPSLLGVFRQLDDVPSMLILVLAVGLQDVPLATVASVAHAIMSPVQLAPDVEARVRGRRTRVEEMQQLAWLLHRLLEFVPSLPATPSAAVSPSSRPALLLLQLELSVAREDWHQFEAQWGRLDGLLRSSIDHLLLQQRAYPHTSAASAAHASATTAAATSDGKLLLTSAQCATAFHLLSLAALRTASPQLLQRGLLDMLPSSSRSSNWGDLHTLNLLRVPSILHGLLWVQYLAGSWAQGFALRQKALEARCYPRLGQGHRERINAPAFEEMMLECIAQCVAESTKSLRAARSTTTTTTMTTQAEPPLSVAATMGTPSEPAVPHVGAANDVDPEEYHRSLLQAQQAELRRITHFRHMTLAWANARGTTAVSSSGGSAVRASECPLKAAVDVQDAAMQSAAKAAKGAFDLPSSSSPSRSFLFLAAPPLLHATFHHFGSPSALHASMALLLRAVRVLQDTKGTPEVRVRMEEFTEGNGEAERQRRAKAEAEQRRERRREQQHREMDEHAPADEGIDMPPTAYSAASTRSALSHDPLAALSGFDSGALLPSIGGAPAEDALPLLTMGGSAEPTTQNAVPSASIGAPSIPSSGSLREWQEATAAWHVASLPSETANDTQLRVPAMRLLAHTWAPLLGVRADTMWLPAQPYVRIPAAPLSRLLARMQVQSNGSTTIVGQVLRQLTLKSAQPHYTIMRGLLLNGERDRMPRDAEEHAET